MMNRHGMAWGATLAAALALSWGAAPGACQSQPGFEALFPKRIDIFGVQVRGTATMPDDKMLHAAHVLAEYLDNDADGLPDDALVAQKLRDSRAKLLMTATWEEWEDIDWGLLPEGALQDQYGSETHPNGAARGLFDATLEEVLHLVTHAGWGQAYPEAFGERPGTRLADAMDLARGGRFASVPAAYPEGAWYTYDDETCDYGCMAAEYIYWAITSLLGAQDFPGRLERIQHEWRLNTPQKLAEGDPAIHALLTDPAYALPTRLPTGRYQGGEIRFRDADSSGPDPAPPR